MIPLEARWLGYTKALGRACSACAGQQLGLYEMEKRDKQEQKEKAEEEQRRTAEEEQKKKAEEEQCY